MMTVTAGLTAEAAGLAKAGPPSYRRRRPTPPAGVAVVITPSRPQAPVALDPALAEARRWLARELHDGPVQALTTMIVELETLRREESMCVEAQRRLECLTETTRGAVTDMRHLLYDLRAEPDAEDLTLWLRDTLARFRAQTGIETSFESSRVRIGLARGACYDMRRLIGEMLTNVRRHSRARRVHVALEVTEVSVAVAISDDGRGFDVEQTAPGLGLRGMQERAHVLGACLTVDSAMGRGTSVRVVVPRRRPS